MALKENYKDDILDVSVNTKRKYRMTENQDGTVSFDDETVYTQEGDNFGASDMNAVGVEVNGINDSLTAYDVDEQEYSTDKFRFAKKDGEFGMLDAEDNFINFGGSDLQFIGNFVGNQTIDVSQYIKEGDTAQNFVIEFMGNDTVGPGANSSSSSTYWGARLNSFTPSKTLSNTTLTIVMSTTMNTMKGSSSSSVTQLADAKTIDFRYNLYYRKI